MTAPSAPQGGGVEAARVCGYTPGMGRVELQLSGDVPDWAELGETVYLTAQPRTDAAQQGEVFAWAKPDEIAQFKRKKLRGGRFGLYVGEVADPDCTVPLYLSPPSAPVGVE